MLRVSPAAARALGVPQPGRRKARVPQPLSELVETLTLEIRRLALPAPVREHRFSERLWRFDLAWPDRKLAVECEGGTWHQGRHTRGRGHEDDCDKYNAAALAGWCLLRFTIDMIHDGRARAALRAAFGRGES